MQCLVYSGLTYEDEAELCYKLDKAKKCLSLSQSTNALLESGRDEEIVEIKQLLERKGFVWALNKSGSKAYEIKAAHGVINAYCELGAPLRACAAQKVQQRAGWEKALISLSGIGEATILK